MLFNSYVFIAVFLPITFLGYLLLAKTNNTSAIIWLVLASLFFYAWWNPNYLFLMLVSISVNYQLGVLLATRRLINRRRILLFAGVALNLGFLGYYKYLTFIVDNINSVLDLTITHDTILLPLTISFFTFQQIAYLVDMYRSDFKNSGFIRYCLFVTFFPQLIAGPIVHHKEMLPQFIGDISKRLNSVNVSIGITIFTIGLFKKVIIADGISVYANPTFIAANTSETLTFLDSWTGALAYTFQLYFDFSGYSDMAIGLARIFGIRLPLNFNSPYKATNIIEFWRRWHITLSRFLKDYLYISLGGNRFGNRRRYFNLMVTMLLGGLWHGAAWTFVLWGGMHGGYLFINHYWRNLRFTHRLRGHALYRALSAILTFTCVVVAWVIFRCDTLDSAYIILHSMFTIAPNTTLIQSNIFTGYSHLYYITVLIFFVSFMPNTQQIMIRYRPAFEVYKNEIIVWNKHATWRPAGSLGIVTAIVFFISFISISANSDFLYFNF